LDAKTTKAILVFKALGDENRMRILEILSTGEKCACSILDKLAIVQSTLSHHMKILCDCGIVEGRQEGKWTYYSLLPDTCEQAGDLLDRLSASTRASAEKEHCQ